MLDFRHCKWSSILLPYFGDHQEVHWVSVHLIGSLDKDTFSVDGFGLLADGEFFALLGGSSEPRLVSCRRLLVGLLTQA